MLICLSLHRDMDINIDIYRSSYNPFPLSIEGTYYLLLTNKSRQADEMRVMTSTRYVIMLYKIVAPVLLESFSLSLPLRKECFMRQGAASSP